MKKILLNILSVSFLITSLFGCIEDPVISPGVKGGGLPVFEGSATYKPSETTASSITVYATIASANGYKIESRGFYWGKNQSPKMDNGGNDAPDTSGEIGIGSYSVTITGLENGETYYILPYAVNSKGMEYGSSVLTVFTNPGLGEISTVKPSDIHASSFKTGVMINDEGEAKIDVAGIYLYLKTDSAAIDSNTVVPNQEDKEYIFNFTGLNPSTQYYVQAFAKNKYGTFYGLTESVTTSDDKFDVGETTVDPGFLDATFSSEVFIGNDETVTIEERGFCWVKTPDEPTINDSIRKCGKNAGKFSVKIENLEAQQAYNVRAYAKNNFGLVVYGRVKSFTTLKDIPSVETELIDETKIQNGSVEVKGIVTSKGMSDIIYSGICWSTSPEPTEITGNFHHVYPGVGVSFTVQIQELKGGVRYYARAYAKNNSGTTYGTERSFVTPSVFNTNLKSLDEKRVPNSSTYFVIDGNLCLLGGDLGADFTNEFLLYNISSNDWSPRRPFVDGPACWQSGVSYGSGAYVFGGYDGKADEKAGLYHYNYGDNQWSYINGPDSVTVCRALGYANSNGVFYIGGTSGDTLARSDVWCYVAQSYWEKKPNFPVEQYGGFAVVIDGIVYAGMGKGSSNVCNGKLWTTTDGAATWNLKTECSIYAGSIFAGVACNRRIYVIDENYYILEYDPATDIWKTKSQIPTNYRDFHCMYSVNNKIYIGLGKTQISIIAYDPLWDN